MEKKTRCASIYLLIIIIISSVSLFFFVIAQPTEPSLTIKQGEYSRIVKLSGIEKFLFYNVSHHRDGTSLIIEADVNLTVYNYLRNNYLNWGALTPQQQLQVCNTIREYILDDYPNFDCLNPTHQTLLLNALQDFITNGWQTFQNGVEIGYIEVSGGHMSISIPNIQNLDRIRIGQFSLVTEYQDINLINYDVGWGEVNVSLFINDSDGWNASNDIWIKNNPDNDKFGANVTRNETSYFKYLIKSTQEIKKENNIVYYISQNVPYQCGVFTCLNEERHLFDFSDICEIKANETEILFNPECNFNQTSEDTLEVYFWGEFNSSLGYISVDPTITITDVSSYASILNNITTENNFTHLTIGDNSIGFINQSNLRLYLPFDVNTSPTHDYTENNFDGTYSGAVWNESGFFGGASQYDGNRDFVWNSANVPLNNLSSFTISMWVYKYTTGLQPLYGEHPNPNPSLHIDYLHLTAGNAIGFDRFPPSGGAFVGTSNINLNQWVHVAYSQNTTTRTSYINGVLDKTDTSPETAYTGSALGAYSIGSYATQYYDGLIDEVMVINTSLTSAQISQIYNNQSSRFFSVGNQEFKVFENEDNRVNVSIGADSNEYFSSNLTGRVGFAGIDNYSTSALPYVPEIWYRFDNHTGENETFVRDYGSRSVNLTCINCPATSSNAIFFKSKDFDGTNDLLTGTDSDIIGNITILVWYNYTTGINEPIISKSDGASSDGEWVFNTEATTDGIEFDCGGTTSVSSGSLTLNKWSFIGMTFNENTNQIVWYINGKRDSTDTNTDSCLIDDTEVIIVGDSGTFAPLNDEIDDLMVFQRILTDDEVNQIYVLGGFDYGYTAYDDLTPNQNTTFTLPDDMNYSYLDVQFNAGNSSTNSFITPNLIDANIDTFNIAAAGDTTNPVVNLVAPTNDSTTTAAENWFAADISDNINATNATLYIWNSTGSEISPSYNLCYQETANVSTDCGGLNTGNYIFEFAESPTNGYDGNFNTFIEYVPGNFTVNYTKPQNAVNSSLYRHRLINSPDSNSSIPSDCWNQPTLLFRAETINPEAMNLTCSDGVGWIQMTYISEAGTGLYEEAMWWNMSSTITTGNSSWSANISFTLPREDTYLWNYLVYDNSSNSAFNSTNWTLTYSAAVNNVINISQGIQETSIQSKIKNQIRNLISNLISNTLISKIYNGFRNIIQQFNIFSLIDRIQGRARDISQQFNIFSLIDRIQGRIRDVSQQLNIFSLTNRVYNSFRSLTQQLNIFSIIDRIFGQSRSPTDSSIITSLTNRVYSGIRGITQSLNIFSLVEKIQGRFRTILQQLNIFSIIDRIFGQSRSPTDSSIITSSVNRIYGSIRAIVQGVGLFFLTLKEYAGFRGINQETSITSLTDRNYGGNRNIAQLFSITSLIDRIQGRFRTVIQQLNIFSLIDRQLNQFRSPTESSIITSSVNRVYSGIRGITQSISSFFSTIRNYSGFRDVNQQSSINSLTTKIYGSIRGITQQLNIFSLVDRIYNQFRSPADSSIITSSVNRVYGSIRGITQQLNIFSLVEKIQGRFRTILQQLNIFTLVSGSRGTTTQTIEFWIGDPQSDEVYHTNLTGSLIDQFDTAGFGATDIRGIWGNGSDFWITDRLENETYHTNLTGSLIDQFDTAGFGSTFPTGIWGNGSDFWITDFTDAEVYHTNLTGSLIDQFDTAGFGAANTAGLWSNGSDFWITDDFDDEVYHTTLTGSLIDQFDTAGFGATPPKGIWGNGSDFWIVDIIDTEVYHTNLTGSLIDQFDTTGFGASLPTGIWGQTTTTEVGATNNIRSIIQSLNIFSITNKVYNSFRSLTQQFNIFSLIDRIFGQSRNPTDSSIITSLTNRVYSGIRGITQSISLFFSTLREYAGFRDVNQQSSINSLTTKIYGSIRGIAQSLNIFSLIDRQLNQFRSPTDSSIITSLTNRVYSGIRGIAQSLNIFSLIERIYGQSRSPTDSSIITSSVNKIYGSIRGITQQLNIFSLTNKVYGSARGIAQQLNIFSLTDKIYGSIRGITQQLNIFSLIERIFGQSRNPTDSSIITSLTNRIYGGIRGITQSISLFFSTLRNYAGFREVNQETSINSLTSRIYGGNRNIAQLFSITSLTEKIQGRARDISQQFNLSSLTNRIYSGFRSLTQSLNIFSLVDKQQGIIRTISQQISLFFSTVAEKTEGTVLIIRNIIQSIVTNSNVAKTASFFRSLFQSILAFFNLPSEEAEAEAVAGGGGGVAIDKRLCEETFNYIEIYGQNNLIPLDNFLDGVENRTQTRFTRQLAIDYIGNWQSRCSLIIERTLEEKRVCEEVLFFLIENEARYNNQDIHNLALNITFINLEEGLLKKYVDKYETKCSLYERDLPFDRIKIPILNFNLGNLEACSPELNLYILGFKLDSSIKFTEKNLGELSCNEIERMRWFIRLEKVGEDYFRTGIRIWIVLLPLSVIILLILIKTYSNRKFLNKMKKEFER